MSKYRDEDGVLVADSNCGTIPYDEAVRITVRELISGFEELIWNFVEDMEYLVGEETLDPMDNGIGEHDGK